MNRTYRNLIRLYVEAQESVLHVAEVRYLGYSCYCVECGTTSHFKLSPSEVTVLMQRTKKPLHLPTIKQ